MIKISDIARKTGMTVKEVRDKAHQLNYAVSQKSGTMNDKVAKEFIEILLKEKRPQVAVSAVAEEAPDESVVVIPDIITVKDFSEKASVPVTRVMTELMKNGVMASINESIDFDTAAIIGEILGIKIEKEGKVHQKTKAYDLVDMVKTVRPPVITIIGHVDHGKTSLLDYIRRANVVSTESGGITQHIGAYQVERGGRAMTFLDTPGHEAFSAMREHGVRITDIAVLVVAADDGVKPQTIESVRFARDAGVPIVVAINKIDKPDANLEKTKGQLAEIDIIGEEWGGSTILAPVSAKTGQGVDELLDLILLVADMKKIEAVTNVPASGFVIESHLSTKQGPVVTTLVRDGVLHLGDAITIGKNVWGKIRSMTDYKGRKIKEAHPSDPVQIAGLSGLPEYGEVLEVKADLGTAKEYVAKMQKDNSIKRIQGAGGLASISAKVQSGECKELPLIVKVDVFGSLQAIRDALAKLQYQEVRIKIISDGIGDVSESDIKLAQASDAFIVAFRVDLNQNARNMMKDSTVQYETFSVIYELIDKITLALSGMLETEVLETETGRGRVLKIFKDSKRDKIIGIRIQDGQFAKESKIVFERGEEIIAEGKIISLQKGEDEVSSAGKGVDCGVRIVFNARPAEGDEERKIVIKEDDEVRVYKKEQKKKELTAL